MKTWLRGLVAAVLLASAAPQVYGQGAVLQGGPVAPGRAPMYATGGTSQPVVIDSGPAGGGALGQGLGELNITSRAGGGDNTAPYASNGTGPSGTHFCMNDAASTNPTGYHYLCFDPNAQGGGLIAYGAGGAATPLPLAMLINGARYEFPFVLSGVIGPSVTVVGEMACWNNTSGTLLSDCGAPLRGPVTTVNGNGACWNGTNGLLLSDCGPRVQGPVSSTIGNLACWNNTSGTLLSDCGPATTIQQVPFNQNAITRTQISKNNDWVSVYDYCDKVDVNGTTDNTACIQNAVDALCLPSGGTPPYRSAGTLYFPVGAYVLSSIGIPCNGLKMQGSGNGNVHSTNLDYRGTVIISTTANAGVMFKNTTTCCGPGGTPSDYGSGFEFSDMAINATGQTAAGWVWDISWYQHAKISNVSIHNPANVVYTKGGAINVLEDVSTLLQRGIGVDFSGDASGCTANFTGSISGSTLTVSAVASGSLKVGYKMLNQGPASFAVILSQISGPTGGAGGYTLTGSWGTVGSQAMVASDLAGCNMRADLLRLKRVSFNGIGGSHVDGMTCINWHNFAQTLTVENFVCENPYIGINIFCEVSQSNNGAACPAFGRFTDFQAENCWYRCVNSSDAQDLVFYNSYLLGFGVGGDVPIAVYNTNFKANSSPSAAGAYANAFRFDGGRVGNSARSNMVIGVSDVIVRGTQFFSANLENYVSHATLWPNIIVSEVNGFTPININISDTILCEASGQQPIGAWQGGIVLDPGVDWVIVKGNIGRLCEPYNGTDLINDNTGETNIVINDNLPTQ